MVTFLRAPVCTSSDPIRVRVRVRVRVSIRVILNRMAIKQVE